MNLVTVLWNIFGAKCNRYGIRKLSKHILKHLCPEIFFTKWNVLEKYSSLLQISQWTLNSTEMPQIMFYLISRYIVCYRDRQSIINMRRVQCRLYLLILILFFSSAIFRQQNYDAVFLSSFTFKRSSILTEKLQRLYCILVSYSVVIFKNFKLKSRTKNKWCR